MLQSPAKIPWRMLMLITLPASQCTGSSCHMPIKSSVLTEQTERSIVSRKAGMACVGERSGLTRKSTISREVTERRADRLIPKSNELMSCAVNDLTECRMYNAECKMDIQSHSAFYIMNFAFLSVPSTSQSRRTRIDVSHRYGEQQQGDRSGRS